MFVVDFTKIPIMLNFLYTLFLSFLCFMKVFVFLFSLFKVALRKLGDIEYYNATFITKLKIEYCLEERILKLKNSIRGWNL